MLQALQNASCACSLSSKEPAAEPERFWVLGSLIYAAFGVTDKPAAYFPQVPKGPEGK